MTPTQLLDASRANSSSSANILDAVIQTALNTASQAAPLCLQNDMDCTNDNDTGATPPSQGPLPLESTSSAAPSASDGSDSAVIVVRCRDAVM